METGIEVGFGRQPVGEKDKSCNDPGSESTGRQVHLMVDNCAVTLHFPQKGSASVMTEIKQMLLTG